LRKPSEGVESRKRPSANERRLRRLRESARSKKRLSEREQLLPPLLPKLLKMR